MWQIRLCLVISIIGCTPVTSTPTKPAELMDGTLVITAYSKIHSLYIDGQQQSLINSGMWNQTDHAGLTNTNRLIAVSAEGDSTCGGLLASFGDSSYVLTNAEWKCSKYQDSGWMNLGFVETQYYLPAVEFGSNGGGHTQCSHLQTIPDISYDAMWIWDSDQAERTIFCRGYLPVCDSYPCLNNGTCLQNNVSMCRCVPQFTGTYCETEILTTPRTTKTTTVVTTSTLQTTTEATTTPATTTAATTAATTTASTPTVTPVCDSSPCQNNGTCLQNSVEMCRCLPQFTGTYCETKLVEALVITAYQELQSLYIDGQQQSLVNGNMWNQTDRAVITKTNRLIAVSAAGDQTCGGILASFGDDYVLTNAEWKCSKYMYAGWTNLGFDDSVFQPAVEFGSNGGGHTQCSHLQTVPDISYDAMWIWDSDQSEKTIYCRGYIPVCDSSPCQNSGTCLQNSVEMCRCLPQFTGTYCETKRVQEVLVITAYQELQSLYIDGQQQTLVNGSMWNQTDRACLTNTNRLIAVSAAGDTTCGGILASFGDSYVLTNAEWKCSKYMDANWMNLGFVENEYYLPAVEFGSNGGGHTQCSHLQTIPDISYDAMWIWDADQSETTIYCRGHIPVCDSSPCQNNGTCLQNEVNLCRCVPQFTGTYCETEL